MYNFPVTFMANKTHRKVFLRFICCCFLYVES